MRLTTIAIGLMLAACSAEPGAAAPPAKAAGPAGAQAAATGETASARRGFRDWMAICDNGNACYAFTAATDGTGWIRIARQPGRDARPEVAVGYWAPEGEVGPPSLNIDGEVYTLTPITEYPLVGEVSADRVTNVVRGLADGRSAQVGSAGDLSLSGASAALLWIDERQGRLDTVTALRRRGGRPAAAVAPPPSLPVVTPAPAVSQAGFGDKGQTLPAALEALPVVIACRTDTADTEWVQKEVMSARLDATTELWAVPCFMGAYNMGHEWFITGPGGRDPRPARLTSTSDDPTSTTINAGYSPETRTITAFAKARGIGDCGSASTWTWTGREFVLTKELEMAECWGVPVDYWPTTWRTR
jgi:hypothetical protein